MATATPKNKFQTTVTGRFVGGGLFEARAGIEGQAEKYSACVVLDEGQVEKVEGIIQAVIDEKWNGKAPPGLKVWGIREGDDPKYDASFEREFINPKSSRAPKTLRREDGLMVAVEKDDDILYPGCNVAVSVSAYGMDGDKKKGFKATISLNLRAVMFLSHGERLGDVVKADEEFEGFESEASEDDLAFLN